MVNRYAKGRRKEYKVMEIERDKGRFVMRSSGSHGDIDVISIDVPEKKILLIQCKTDIFTKKGDLRKSFKELEEKGKMFNGVYNVEFVVR